MTAKLSLKNSSEKRLHQRPLAHAITAKLSPKNSSEKDRLIQAIACHIRLSGLSSRDIEAMTGVSKTHVNDITNLKTRATIDMLLVLADYFHIEYEFKN
jgi:antitoxin component HigA of HigAB toxin-antitoxin module